MNKGATSGEIPPLANECNAGAPLANGKTAAEETAAATSAAEIGPTSGPHFVEGGASGGGPGRSPHFAEGGASGGPGTGSHFVRGGPSGGPGRGPHFDKGGASGRTQRVIRSLHTQKTNARRRKERIKAGRRSHGAVCSNVRDGGGCKKIAHQYSERRSSDDDDEETPPPVDISEPEAFIRYCTQPGPIIW